MPDGDESGGGRGWVKVLIAALTPGFSGPPSRAGLSILKRRPCF